MSSCTVKNTSLNFLFALPFSSGHTMLESGASMSVPLTLAATIDALGDDLPLMTHHSQPQQRVALKGVRAKYSVASATPLTGAQVVEALGQLNHGKNSVTFLDLLLTDE